MRVTGTMLVSATILASLSACSGPEYVRISRAEYNDKVYASWLGQCIGNMYGLAHEWAYNDEPRTEPITGWDDRILERIREADGAFSDDDTDIEYVDLFCMEKHGPEPTYEDLADFWKLCIVDHIWAANRAARDLMSRGYLPPLTGRKELNPKWYKIDPQLVCEIWAVTAPGMLEYAAAKADWAAKVTNDDYGTHPTIWYNTMYAAAFFETDVEKLCQIGYEHVPEGSIFREAIDDVRGWKTEHGDNWVAVRKKIKEKYLDRKGLQDDITTDRISAVLNGALGVLALLYGEGDFEKTMNFACMAGYDADNQCATLAGLIAICHGSKTIPHQYTHVLDGWTLPLNDFYKNRTRKYLPDGRLTEIASRTVKIAEELIAAKGGRIRGTGDDAVLLINPHARFIAPLEVRIYPFHLDVDAPAVVRTELIGGDPADAPQITIGRSLPPGLRVDTRDGQLVLVGTPTQSGEYEIELTVADRSVTRKTKLPLFVRE